MLFCCQAEWFNDQTRPSRSWPDEGKVAFEDYSTRYREGLDLVLRGITVSINGGEKVCYVLFGAGIINPLLLS